MIARTAFSFVVALLIVSPFVFANAVSGQDSKAPDNATAVSKEQAIATGVEQLLKIQNDDGAWPYEGVYRVDRKIPVGYRIGGTAICCEALLYATPADHQSANDAIARGIDLILKELKHPNMKPSQEDRYDVRVWGHIYALDLFCRVLAENRLPTLEKEIKPWIPKLTAAVLHQELKSGGWNYANHRHHAGFVTAPAVQALLWARSAGEEIDDEVFQRAADAIARSRNQEGAFAYSGDENEKRPALLPGSIARSANCELTLALLGLEGKDAIQFSINAFHEHWNELEKRRKKSGTHKPPYGVAPYYFYYGHRYAAQAIQRLPEANQPAEFEKLFKVFLKTRDPDGTWNDRVFDRSKAYGTAMVILGLLEHKAPLPAENRLTIDSEPGEEKD